MAGNEGWIADLLEALGGAARIASVASYARDALIRIQTSSDTRPSAPLTRKGDRCDSGAPGLESGRELTFRAAGGRVRIERTFPGAGVAPVRTELAVAGPEARHAHPGGEPAGSDPRKAAACAACAGERALGEARLEPRTLLAHAVERGAAPGLGAGGAIEVTLAAEGLVYRFDPRSGLCAERIDRLGGRTVYRDWRVVGGVATPFFEIETRPGAVLERRLLGAAYDLRWPGRLFRLDSTRTL